MANNAADSTSTLSAHRRRILRTPDAATYIALSASSLEKMRSAGNGPRYLRLGGRAIGYDVGDLDEWLDQRRREATEPSSETPDR